MQWNAHKERRNENCEAVSTKDFSTFFCFFIAGTVLFFYSFTCTQREHHDEINTPQLKTKKRQKPNQKLESWLQEKNDFDKIDDIAEEWSFSSLSYWRRHSQRKTHRLDLNSFKMNFNSESFSFFSCLFSLVYAFIIINRFSAGDKCINQWTSHQSPLEQESHFDSTLSHTELRIWQSKWHNDYHFKQLNSTEREEKTNDSVLNATTITIYQTPKGVWVLMWFLLS